jgi:hypothetical protein
MNPSSPPPVLLFPPPLSVSWVGRIIGMSHRCPASCTFFFFFSYFWLMQHWLHYCSISLTSNVEMQQMRHCRLLALLRNLTQVLAWFAKPLSQNVFLRRKAAYTVFLIVCLFMWWNLQVCYVCLPPDPQKQKQKQKGKCSLLAKIGARCTKTLISWTQLLY